MGTGPYFDPEITNKPCRNCGKAAELLGHNAKLFPDVPVTTPAQYYPLCLPCAQSGG